MGNSDRTIFFITRGMLRALATCAHKDKTTRPALCHIHIEREGKDGLTLVSTNLDTAAVISLDSYKIQNIMEPMEKGVSFPASLIPNNGSNNHEFTVEIEHGETESTIHMHGPVKANPNYITDRIKPVSAYAENDIAWRGLFLTDIPERKPYPEKGIHWGLGAGTLQTLAKLTRLLDGNIQFFTDGSGKNPIYAQIGTERNFSLTVMPRQVDFIYRREGVTNLNSWYKT